MTTDAPADTSRDQLVERLFSAVLGMIDLEMTYVGDRLGLYRALAEGSATAGELASTTSTEARYVREWLEQQAVAGILEVDDVTPSPPALAATACRRRTARYSPTATASTTWRRSRA